ncbi:hypothetical protein WDZ92_23805 [Nostoc sp. NIES-2111]
MIAMRWLLGDRGFDALMSLTIRTMARSGRGSAATGENAGRRLADR